MDVTASDSKTVPHVMLVCSFLRQRVNLVMLVSIAGGVEDGPTIAFSLPSELAGTGIHSLRRIRAVDFKDMENRAHFQFLPQHHTGI